MLLQKGADACRTCKLGDGQVSAKDMAQGNVEINRLLDEAIAKKTGVEGGAVNSEEIVIAHDHTHARAHTHAHAHTTRH